MLSKLVKVVTAMCTEEGNTGIVVQETNDSFDHYVKVRFNWQGHPYYRWYLPKDVEVLNEQH